MPPRALLTCALLSAAHAHAEFPRERLARLLGLEARAVSAVEVPTTPPSCRVVGTLHSRVVSYSLATVRCANRTVDVWVGDRIDDGLLVGIGHGEIFVSRGERIERIGTGAPAAIAPNAPPTMDLVRTARAHVNAALRDPTSVMSEVRMLPAFVEGRWQGLRATWVKEGSWLAELGLQRGDVIRAVNGRPLDGLESSMAVLAELPTRQEVEVELDRNGQRSVRRVRIE